MAASDVVSVFLAFAFVAVVTALGDAGHDLDLAAVKRLKPPELNRTPVAVEGAQPTSPPEAPLPPSPGGLPPYPPKPDEFAYRRFISYPNGEKSETCEDLTYTGIRFRTGAKALCPDLVDYCSVNSTKIARKVRYACQKTCGMCALEATEWPSDKPCEDLHRDALPVLTAGGTPQECADLTAFCAGNAHSELVSQKCPVTCGKCTPSTPPPEVHSVPVVDPHRAWITTPLPTLPPDAESDINNGVRIDSHDAPIECSRRRRWGFCYTRRRRDYI